MDMINLHDDKISPQEIKKMKDMIEWYEGEEIRLNTRIEALESVLFDYQYPSNMMAMEI
jgi:hypothetical protein